MTNPESLNNIRLSNHADLLKNESSEIGASTIAADFGRSFVQSAAIEPVWNGLGQLVTAGKLPHFSIVNEENAAKSNADSWAQKFGSAFGIAADIVLLSKGKKALFGGGPGKEALAVMPWQERALNHGYEGLKLGAFYGAVLTPSDPKENLLWGRVANAGSQAITFGLLNYGSEFLGAAKFLQNIKAGTGAAALKDMSAMGLAGMPAGVAGVIADSALRGKELQLAHMSNAATDFAVIGFAMAGLTHGVGALGRPDLNGVTTARHITDSLGLSRTADRAPTQADFRIVGGKTEFEAFYKNRLNSDASIETTINVQRKLHGALNGIFGDKFASYGDTRPLLLRHGSDFTATPPSLAGSLSLIASCERLPSQFRANDVFPERSTAKDSSVWLQPTGENTFRLSREKSLEALNGKEAVMLGLPRLQHLDAREIKAGQELEVNDKLQLFRDGEGSLFAVAKPGSSGVWTRLEPGVERRINLSEPVYSSDLLIEADAIKQAADSTPGYEKRLPSSAVTAILKPDGEYYLRGPVSTERIYTRIEPGIPVEVSPVAKFIHLGPDGILPVTNHEVKVPRAPVERPAGIEENPGRTGSVPGASTEQAGLASESTKTPEEISPLVPAAPLTRIDLLDKPEPPQPPKERPVVDVPVESLAALASRLSGKSVDLADPTFRSGKFGEVVLDKATGGVDAGDGTIRPIFGDFESAQSAGRFTSGIFKRRLQTDPRDPKSAPGMKVTVDEFQDPAGTAMYIPVISIRDIGTGRLVLADDLRPLGIQSSTNLITIDQKSRR